VAGPRVVLAEDHATMARDLKALLSREFMVDVVSDGQQLIDAVEESLPDVIVSDISMPGMSGLASARTILTKHPDARIIFVTVRDEPAVIAAALSEGALGYVVKCDAGDELEQAVRWALRGARYISATAIAALARLEGQE